MLKLGEKIIKDLYLGDKAISKVFLGARLIYQKIVGEPIFLDYVHFDGNCYVDTGIKLQTCTIETAVKYESGHSRRMLSGWVGYNNLYWGMTTSGTFELGSVSLSSGTSLTDYTEIEIVYDITAKTATPTVDGFTNSYTITPDYSNTYTIGCSIPTSGNKVIGDVYYHRFKDVNNVIIQDLRPCIHPNGTVCFYDMITKKYFYNQGTGTLTAGNKINFVDYIIFDGNSWINVDYIPSSNTRVVGKCSFTAWKTTGANYVFGVFGDSANFGFNAGQNRAILNVSWGSNSGIQMTNNTVLGQVYSFDISKNGVYIDDVLKIGTSQLSATFTANKSFFVGWSNGTSTEKLIGNVYPMQMYENDVLKKDLRPCIINDVIGLYDMVAGKFYTNIGTGTLKVPHIELDYIITDGNSYIDTEYCPNENTLIEYTFEVLTKPTGFQGLFGSRQDTAYYPYNVFVTGSQAFRMDYGRYDETAYFFDLNKKYTIKAGDNSVYLNNELLKSYTVAYKGTSPYSMYLGNFNNKGTPYTTGTPQRIYPCPIYENGVLVRDFKPCIAPNGQVAMYDEVNNKYHYGQGTGELKAGGRFVQSILFDGASYINTGIAHQTCDVECIIKFEETGARQLMGFGSSTAQYWGKPANSVIVEGLAGSNVTDKTNVIIEYNCDDSTAPTIVRNADGKTSAVSTGKTVSTMPYIIGALVWGSSATTNGYHCTCEIWGNKFTANGVVIQDLRPYVDSDGVACFKDVVTGELFYNEGTGTLTYKE